MTHFRILPSKILSILLFAVIWLLSLSSSFGQTAGSSISLPTELRIQGSGWWPRKAEAARDAYVGSAACAKCHTARAEAQASTAMAHASSLVADAESLRAHQRLTFRLGDYNYNLHSDANKSTLSVTKGEETRSHDLQWAIGQGHMGQTFLYDQDGTFYESHLSFYSELQALDITPGHERGRPATLEDALGLKQPRTEIERCFSCHATASKAANEFNPSHAFAGVTCESCHGPGGNHIAAVSTQQGTGDIFNPALLPPVDSVDFCGACHRTWQDVVGSGLTGVGVFNVRFAPYRLENSKCWQKTRSNLLTCVACHDPHQPLVHDLASYDSRCLQCHGPSAHSTKKLANQPKACPVSTKECVACHMPKVRPPNLHSDFTDHWIRIAKRGSPYPD
jgi:hypothetical protein